MLLRQICAALMMCATLWAQEGALYVYSWYDYIPSSLVRKFEEKTGIKVYLDFFENAEAMEAQLLVKSNGYDLVMPGAYPYGQRHILHGLYQKIDYSALPNARHLDPALLENLRPADPEGAYLIPYIWGTVGIGVDLGILDKVFPGFQGDPRDLIFDPTYASKLAPYGIYLMDDALELFAAMLVYLGYNAESEDPAEIEEAFQKLRSIRPYVRRFDVYRGIADFSNQEVAVVQAYNMHVAMSQLNQPDPEIVKDLAFLHCTQAASFWVDCFAIPADAQNPGAAHQFINFLLEPENSAEVTRKTAHPTSTKSSWALLPEDLRKNDVIFIDWDRIEKTYLATAKTRERQRLLSRLLMKLKTGY